jgi:serine/threonine protein kinase
VQVEEKRDNQQRIVEACNARGHVHIMPLLASFDSEGIGFLLLPAASTDLARFWRSSPEGQATVSVPGRAGAWIIGQPTGLAHAVATLHLELKSASGEKLCCIHDDIEASNILVFRSSSITGGAVLRLADFGFSQLLETSNEQAELTTASLSGTYAYLEPARGASVAPATHIWGLGALFLEAMVWFRHGANDLEAFTELRVRRSCP